MAHVNLQEKVVELEKALEESKKFLLEYGDAISARVDALEAKLAEAEANKES